MTTPKGARRREALVDAAAELLRDSGFGAVRHRAVAARAGLSLSATTYYFDSLDDLVAAAVQRQAAAELTACRARLARGDADRVEVVLDALLGPDPALVPARYELLVAVGRRPFLRPVMQEVNRELRALLTDALGELDVELAMAVVDGAVVAALTAADPDPRAAARTLLTRWIQRIGAGA